MRKHTFLSTAILVIASLLLGACAQATPTTAPTPPPPEPTAVPPTDVPEPAIGSPEHPIKVLFVPSVDANMIITGGEVMSQALNEATGLNFEVGVPTSYTETIQETCAR